MEVDLEPGPLRRLATMGTLAIIAMLFMYLFATKQVTDTESPRVAALTHDVLQRNLVKGSQTSLVLRSKATAAARHYELTLHPVARLAADPGSLGTLLLSAAEIVIEEVGDGKSALTVTCVAVLPDSEHRVTYDRRLQKVAEPDLPARPSSGEDR